MLKIKRIQEANSKNKKVLLRVDFNVAVEKNEIKENFKIKSVQKTLRYLLEQEAQVALISHLGRPKGKEEADLSFKLLSKSIGKILGVKIKFVNNCIGKEVLENLVSLEKNEVLLLENVRFHQEEKENDEEFAKNLSVGFDLFINEAFSVSHRDQASVTGVTKFLPSYAGLHLQQEIKEMEKVKNDFVSPAVAIIGGAKIATKLPVINFFERNYNYILVGGKVANEALDEKIKFSDKVILPTDFVDERLDIGEKTILQFKEIISEAKTVVWNGPMGKFEEERYAKGSYEILQAVLSSEAYVVIGGGETVEILEKNKALDKVDFVSTGGGAMLAYLGGEKMPGIEVLECV